MRLYLKVLALMLAMVLILPFALSCDSQQTDDPQNSDEITTTEKVEDTQPTVFSLEGYNVIRSDSASQDIIKQAFTLTQSIKSLTGVNATLSDDWIKDGEELPSQAKEILIGKTTRSESIAVFDSLGENEFCIKYFPNSLRVVICGKTDEATLAALKYFTQTYLESATASPQIAADLNFTYSLDHKISDCKLNGVSIQDYTIVVPKSFDNDDKYSTILLQKAIKLRTGYTVKSSTDEKFTSGNAILIGKTSLTDSASKSMKSSNAGYAIGTQGEHVVLCGYGGMTVKATRDLIDRLFGDEFALSVDLTLDKAEIVVPKTQTLPDASELGQYPVVMTDKPNSCVSVYDIAPVIDGGQPKQTWSFKPTTTNGFSSAARYGTENRLRYSEIEQSYIFAFVSSSSYAAIASYPDGKCIWEATDLKGNSPHSIEYLPNGTVAVACSGAGDETKSFVFLYTTLNGKKSSTRFEADLDGAHALLWDDIRDVLWALGNTRIVAYEVGEDPYNPTFTEISAYECDSVKGGHDLSVVYGMDNMLWISGSTVWMFDRAYGVLTTNYPEYRDLNAGSVKGICSFPDGVVVRTRETISGTYSTDRLLVLKLGGVAKQEIVFTNNLFYKARVFVAAYH